jgi:hypothetical protein
VNGGGAKGYAVLAGEGKGGGGGEESEGVSRVYLREGGEEAEVTGTLDNKSENGSGFLKSVRGFPVVYIPPKLVGSLQVGDTCTVLLPYIPNT